MDFASIDAYLNKLYSAKAYKTLDLHDREDVVFEAQELLESHFEVADLNEKHIAKQVLFVIEGEDEEYAKLRRNGVKSYAVKGVSVTFNDLVAAGVSPGVADLLLPKLSAAVGRLV